MQKIREQGLTTKGIEIGDDCWLGYGVKVLDGVTIGQGSIVGAGAVVTKNLPPYSIAVGVPAKVIGSRQLVKEKESANSKGYIYINVEDGNFQTGQLVSLNAAIDEMGRSAQIEYQSDRTTSHNGLAQPSLEKLLQATLECIRCIMKVDTVAVLLQTASGQQLAVRATLGLEEEIKTGVRIPLGQGFAGKVAAQKELTIIDDLSKIEVVSPVLRQKGLQSMLGVPLFDRDRVIGVFHIGSLHPRHFTDDEAQTMRHVADRIGEVIEPVMRLEQMLDYV